MIQKDDVERIIKNYIRENLSISVQDCGRSMSPNTRRIDVILDGDVICSEWLDVTQNIDYT